MARVRLGAPLLGVLWHIGVVYDQYPNSLHSMVVRAAMAKSEPAQAAFKLPIAGLAKNIAVAHHADDIRPVPRIRRKIPNA